VGSWALRLATPRERPPAVPVFVAVLDIALVFIVFKGDVRLS
jgi:hypothetical protein